jgi:hypothetical protein
MALTAPMATTRAMMMDFMKFPWKDREVHSLRDWARRGCGAFDTERLLRSVDTEHLRGSTQLHFVAVAKKTKEALLKRCFRFLACRGFYTHFSNLVRRDALESGSKSLSLLGTTSYEEGAQGSHMRGFPGPCRRPMASGCIFDFSYLAPSRESIVMGLGNLPARSSERLFRSDGLDDAKKFGDVKSLRWFFDF